MEQFITWFAGEWTNRTQHFHDPRKFTLVELKHEYLGNNTFHFQQIRNVTDVYREGHYKLTFNEDGSVLCANYTLDMELKEGCEVLFIPHQMGNLESGIKRGYYQGNAVGECYAIMNEQETRFVTDAKLFEDCYMVWDRGYDPIATGRMIWGSNFGPYIFRRLGWTNPQNLTA